MSTRRIVSTSAPALLALCLASLGCGAPARAQRAINVRIATGLPGMTFKPLGAALVAGYARAMPDVHFEVVETAGSVRNLQDLQQGGAELGLVLADVSYMAYNGHISELAGAARAIRGLAVLHPSVVHVLVPADSAVQSIADLRGRRLGVGPPGSGSAITSALLLNAFGVQPTQVQEHAMPFIDLGDALARGDLDAAFIVAADPVEAVGRPMAKGARLLDIGADTVKMLRAAYPFLQPTVIPAGTYAGYDRPVQTVRVDVLLACREGLDDVFVRRLTAALFQILPDLAAGHDYLRLMDLRRAPATPIPLHPGAALYYREQELLR